MPSCVYSKCTNYDSKVNKSQGIGYHVFPTDEVRLQDWIAIVRQQRNQSDWTPSKSSRICSDHFEACDKYVTNKGRTRIKKDAVPFIEVNRNESIIIPNSPTSLDNVSISDKGDESKTPLNWALRKRVRDLVIDKKDLQKRNKILNQKNKRLKIKVARMKLILKEIRSKVIILVK
ncbi:THAP domain-containing protein 2-like [Nymphalis io]|uniref:THAP domain-containing protein 2-like n=1 Tax=Inachis io TaxID=171585 RepID=UPI00216894BD|nr:THAP domain-containing protein 2-like [Nymphalis io]